MTYPPNPPRRRYSPFAMTDKSVKLILPSQIALHDLSISLEYDTPGIMVSVVFLCDKRPLTVHKMFQILIQDSDNLSDGEPGVRTVKQEELEGSLVSISLVISSESRIIKVYFSIYSQIHGKGDLEMFLQT